MFHWCTGQGSMRITHDTPPRGLEGQVSKHSCAYTHKGNKDACARTGWSRLVDAYSQPFMHTPIHTSLWLTLNTFCRRSMWTWLCASPLKPCAPYYVFSSFREGADSKLRNYGWRIREKFDLKKRKRWKRWGKSDEERRMVILKFFLIIVKHFFKSNFMLPLTWNFLHSLLSL